MKFNVLTCKYINKIWSIKSYVNFTKIKFQHKTEEHIAPTTTPALQNKHLFECVVAAQCAHICTQTWVLLQPHMYCCRLTHVRCTSSLRIVATQLDQRVSRHSYLVGSWCVTSAGPLPNGNWASGTCNPWGGASYMDPSKISRQPEWGTNL